MDKLREMSVFVHVAEAGSFSAAARQLSLTPSGVSKLIARLEDRLGILLLSRDSRSVALTEEGLQFYHSARQAVMMVEDAESAAAAATSTATGTLRIHTIPTFASHLIAPVLPEFLRQNPAVRVEFHLSNESIGVLNSGTDIAIQSGLLSDSNLIVRKLVTVNMITCASPSYLAINGIPETPAELLHHDCLNFSSDKPWQNWEFDGEIAAVGMTPRVVVNHGGMMTQLAVAGAGVARLADYQARPHLDAGQLVRLLHNHDFKLPIYALYHSRKHLSQRVRLFLELLTSVSETIKGI